MFKKLRIKTLMILILTTLLSILAISKVYAATTSITSVLAGITVRAEKSVYPGSSLWSASVGSYAANTIGTIGYTWWTAREECRQSNGTYAITYQWNAPNGRANYLATQLYDAGNFYTHSCASNKRKFWSMGTHDFKQGTSVWQPTINYSVLYP
jgi:hypothetical protein